jgi:hypothetical protein
MTEELSLSVSRTLSSGMPHGMSMEAEQFCYWWWLMIYADAAVFVVGFARMRVVLMFRAIYNADGDVDVGAALMDF